MWRYTLVNHSGQTVVTYTLNPSICERETGNNMAVWREELMSQGRGRSLFPFHLISWLGKRLLSLSNLSAFSQISDSMLLLLRPIRIYAKVNS